MDDRAYREKVEARARELVAEDPAGDFWLARAEHDAGECLECDARRLATNWELNRSEDRGYHVRGAAQDFDVDAAASVILSPTSFRTRMGLAIFAGPSPSQREARAMGDVQEFVRCMRPGDVVVIHRHELDPHDSTKPIFTVIRPVDPVIEEAIKELNLQLRVDRHMREIKERMR